MTDFDRLHLTKNKSSSPSKIEFNCESDSKIEEHYSKLSPSHVLAGCIEQSTSLVQSQGSCFDL
jgi:hypothetical protein